MSDCNNCGKCRWAGCENSADYVMQGVTVKRSLSHVFVGDVDLCGGHYRWAQKLGRLNLDWSVIEEALEATA